MKKIEVKIKLSEKASVPTYATSGSSGMDIRVIESGVIKKNEIKLIKTGIYLEIPDGYEAQIRPRSGLALKHGITILNTPGTIDADYRGEICLIVANFGSEDFPYNAGDRLAQMVFSKVVKAELTVSDTLNETERNKGGFGHSGRE